MTGCELTGAGDDAVTGKNCRGGRDDVTSSGYVYLRIAVVTALTVRSAVDAGQVSGWLPITMVNDPYCLLCLWAILVRADILARSLAPVRIVLCVYDVGGVVK